MEAGNWVTKMQRMMRFSHEHRRPITHYEQISGCSPHLSPSQIIGSADNCAALELVDRNDASQFDNRLGDNWHPLTAICDLAGGKWPERIREAANGISAASSDENDRGIELLADIRRLFDDEHCERFGAEALVNRLIGLEETPWAEWRSDGRAITSRGVAAMLKNFEVKSVKMRDGRFYLREHFEDAWNAYLPSDAHRGEV